MVERHVLKIVSGNLTFRGMGFYLHSYVKRPMAYHSFSNDEATLLPLVEFLYGILKPPIQDTQPPQGTVLKSQWSLFQ